MKWFDDHLGVALLLVMVVLPVLEVFAIGLWHGIRGTEWPPEMRWKEIKREFVKERRNP